jgi:hypothetical protein
LKKPAINPVSTLSILAGNGLVSTDEVGRREIGFPVVIESVDEPINKQPPVHFGAHMFGLHSWLSTKAND